MKGDLEDARRWSAQVSKYAEGSPSPTWELVPVRLLIASGDKQAAAEKLRHLADKDTEAGGYGLLIWNRIYQALTADSAEEALVFLADALKRGEPEGYVRPFTQEGKLLAPLLRQAVRSGIEPEYARKLLTIIEAEEKRKLATRRAPPLLSEREMDVLRLLAEGLSTREIASRLVISLSTAKNHIHHVLEKLNVPRRTQAVARARELKLL